VILKPQIPIGGRGKAGAIAEASSNQEAGAKIASLFSTEINGYKAKKILIEEKLEIVQEYFMADRCFFQGRGCRR
jgi:succinyl-CoA synthetase beta subunit